MRDRSVRLRAAHSDGAAQLDVHVAGSGEYRDGRRNAWANANCFANACIERYSVRGGNTNSYCDRNCYCYDTTIPDAYPLVTHGDTSAAAIKTLATYPLPTAIPYGAATTDGRRTKRSGCAA